MPWASFFGWLTIPLLIGLSLLLFRRFGFADWQLLLLGILLALNPYITLFGINLLSENLFLCLLLGSLLVAARSPSSRSALGAGFLASFAFLTRSAGIVLLVSQPVAYLWRRQRQAALWFLAGMFPATAVWMAWARLHTPPAGEDWILAYYTNYFAYQIQNAPLSMLHIVVWKNLDALLYSMGSLIFPKVFDLLPAKIVAQMISLAMIAGVVRMAKKLPAARDYALFAAGSVGLLLIWHFPPTERFLLPIAPLLFAGLITELEHMAGLMRSALKHKDRSQRVVAAAMATAAAVFLLACVALQIWVGQVYMPDTAARWRERKVERKPAYDWIRKNTSPEAVFVAYDDGPLYLETGRHAFSVPLPTRFWYLEEYNQQVDIYRKIDQLARNHGARYVYYSKNDLDRDAAPDQRSAVAQAMRDNVHLRPVWQGVESVIFEVLVP